MSASTVITEGFGTFGSNNFVVTQGFGDYGGAPPPPPPPAVADVISNFSLRGWRKWHRPEDERHLTDLGITPAAAEIIADVAEQQAGRLRLDEQQRLAHLRGEMRLRGLEMQTRHIEALNAERGRLIDAEIGKMLKLLQDNNERITLLLISQL